MKPFSKGFADIHLFLGEFFRDLAASEITLDYNHPHQRYPEIELPAESTREELVRVAIHHAKRAKLRTHQMIDVESGDYITKPEETEWKYKPCYDKLS